MKLANILLCFIILISCKTKNEEAVTNEIVFSVPSWADDAVLYEVNTRQFSESGDFAGIESQLDRLKDLGVEILWLMPIHRISDEKRKATGDILVVDIEDEEERKKYLGSPYAVADYRSVSPNYGDLDDFKKLLKATHDRDMKLILDWVPNHTGWDHAWITEHPDWYTQDAEGNILDPINPETNESWGWTDVADLNYDNKDMRKAMIEEMAYWVSEVGIDGFRVDVAHGIEQGFWDECSDYLININPKLFLLAESEIPSHRNDSTFHATYGWSFHHVMNEIARGEKNAKDIDHWLAEDRRRFGQGFHIHFTSNHDENTWSGTVFDRMGDAHKALAVLAATFDGMPLIYNGQEEPLRKRLPFFTKEYLGFSSYAYADFYRRLFKLKKDNQAIWNGDAGGELEKLVEDENIYAFKRKKGKAEVYVFINLDDEQHAITLNKTVKGGDIFKDEPTEIKEGETLSLEAWDYLVISNN